MNKDNWVTVIGWSLVVFAIAVYLSITLTGCDDTDSHDSTVITVCEVCWPPGHCMREDHPQFDEWWLGLTEEERSNAEWHDCEDYHYRPPRTPWLTNSEME